MLKWFFRGCLLAAILLLTACSTISQDGPPRFNVDVSRIPNATPESVPYSRYGNSTYRVDGHTYYVLSTAKGYDEKGIASWYGMKFYKHKTSNGEIYSVYGMSAASRNLPIPCYVKVTNLNNGYWVVVKVNDRGPFDRSRILDLSYAAAKKLDMLGRGTAYVRVQAINADTWNPRTGVDSSWGWRGQSSSSTSYQDNSAPQSHGKPTLYLQVGAFDGYANAEKLRDQVAAITSLPVNVNHFSDGRGAPYRVQVGPVPSVEASDRLTERLVSAGFGEPMQIIN